MEAVVVKFTATTFAPDWTNGEKTFQELGDSDKRALLKICESALSGDYESLSHMPESMVTSLRSAVSWAKKIKGSSTQKISHKPAQLGDESETPYMSVEDVIRETQKNRQQASRSLLSEAKSDELTVIHGEDSLDDQVDRLFIQYEEAAKRVEVKETLRRTTRNFLLEISDEEEDDEDQIDVSKFANSVVRLTENIDNLLEVKQTLLRRAAKFLIDGYDDSVVSQFEDELLDNHGLKINKSDKDMEEDKESPRAGAAGPLGAGGA